MDLTYEIPFRQVILTSDFACQKPLDFLININFYFFSYMQQRLDI